MLRQRKERRPPPSPQVEGLSILPRSAAARRCPSVLPGFLTLYLSTSARNRISLAVAVGSTRGLWSCRRLEAGWPSCCALNCNPRFASKPPSLRRPLQSNPDSRGGGQDVSAHV